MRVRVSAATLKRLEALERQKGERRPAMLVPRLVSCDEWEALAAPSQLLLKENVVKYVAPDYGGLPSLELVVCR